MVKSQYKQDLLALVHKNKTAISPTLPALLARVYSSNTYLLAKLSSSFSYSKVVSLSYKSSTIQWEISKTCNIVSSRVILSTGYRRYCGSFLWKWMKHNPWIHRFLSWRKIVMILIFDLILDFSKETHPIRFRDRFIYYFSWFSQCL